MLNPYLDAIFLSDTNFSSEIYGFLDKIDK